ncbi:MAG: efflux RND transporter periplasmic adaptor subunit [Candidatus Cloacimonetes bacterium]|nr:efflux RND transporter periplasmic adaptor subunit [Candidatus Cloacimonadota bacterium]
MFIEKENKNFYNRLLKKYFSIFLFFKIIFFLSCGQNNNDRPANMEEIHRERGIPVRVQEIELTEFIVDLEYQTTVNGIRETRVYASITDRVESVNARIGQQVTTEEIIIQFPQDNPQVNYFQAQAAFQMAEVSLDRTRSLYETRGVTQHELDGYETQFRVAEANWIAAQQAVNVRAPFAGMITDIDVRQMQRVIPGDYLFTVSQLNRLHGRIWISASDINEIPQNARVIFKRDGVEKIGRVTSIAMTLNPVQNAFAADIEIDNADFAIRGGVTGSASIVIYRNEFAISVPRSVVLKDTEGQDYVYVSENEVAIRKNVTIGNQSELNFEIIDGLTPGDMLIIQGLSLLRDGARVRELN